MGTFFKDKLFLSGLLALAGAFHGIGITLPMLRIESIKILRVSIFRDKTPSILDLVADLYVDGETWILLLVCLFSILFPIFKIIVVHGMLVGSLSRKGRLGRAVQFLGKWSMAEIFLVAIVIYAVKTAGVASVATEPGLWFYAAAIFLTAFAAHFAKHVQDTHKPESTL